MASGGRSRGLGRFLMSMGLEPSRWRNGIVGEHVVDEVGVHGRNTRIAKPVRHPDRPPGYVVGDLATARASFVAATCLPVTWEDVFYRTATSQSSRVQPSALDRRVARVRFSSEKTMDFILSRVSTLDCEKVFGAQIALADPPR